MSNQPQLGARPIVLVVRGDEAEDVVVTEHTRLVDLHLPHPGLLIQRGEDLDGHVTAPPDAPPDLSKPALADALSQQNLSGHCPLQQQR